MVGSIKELNKEIGLAAEPSTKAMLMLKLANELLGTNTYQAFETATAAITIATHQGKQHLVAEGHKIKGLCHYINSKPKEAMDCFATSVKIYTTLSDSHGLAGVTLNMGIVKMQQGDYSGALMFCEQAAKLFAADEPDLTGIAKCYNNIGVIYERTGEYVKALEMFEKSLAKCKMANNMRDAENAEGNIALIYKALGWNEQALEKMLMYKETYGNELNKVKYCACLLNIGDVYVALGNMNKGLEYFQLTLKVAKEIDHQRSIAVSYTGLGKVMSQLGGHKESQGYYQKALDIFTTLNEPDGVCSAYVGMGTDQLSAGMYEMARVNFEKGLELALEHGFQHEQFEIYRSLVTLYNAIGQPDEAAFMEAKSLPLRILYRT